MNSAGIVFIILGEHCAPLYNVIKQPTGEPVGCYVVITLLLKVGYPDRLRDAAGG